VIESPYWWTTVDGLESDARTAPPVLGGTKYDVAIVGGGYTGLSAARTLARAGASVLVLERERAGWGASSRNGGQVLTGLKVEPAALVARYGESRARELFESSLESIAALESVITSEAIECDYEASGHLVAACKPSHFAAFRDEQALLSRVFNHRVELVSKDDQPAEIGSDLYHGLMIDERSRGINPARYVAGLAAAARRAGATLVEDAAVRRVAQRGPRWSVATSCGDVDAGDVLMATNGYTDEAVPELRRRLIPIGSYVIATAPLDATVADALLPRRRMAFDSKHFLYYFRLTRDQRLLFGGRAEFSRPDVGTTRRAAAILERGMTEVFPDLHGTPVEFAWGGSVAFTRDQMPHAGRLEGAYYAAGYCGHGIAMATYLGALVARRLGGEAVSHPLLDDSSNAFAAIPLYRGNPWFLPLAGAYYRVLDLIQ
jgi:glycine/D-amino acid oxidase-like deaminating enzyme